MDAVIDAIRNAWSWRGVEPVEVVALNAFGNVVFSDSAGRYWRLCPEELSCEVVADTKARMDALFGDAEFLSDWKMEAFVASAHAKLGAPAAGHCYCLKLPGVLGGKYEVQNVGIVPHGELVAFSGDLARQVADLPDGATIELRIE